MKKGKIINCLKCLKETYIYPYEVKKGNRNFCSTICSNNYLAKFQRGENHHNWKAKIEKICKSCNKEFKIGQCRINAGQGKFCSQECSKFWRRKYGSWNKGKKSSLKTRKKMSEYQKKNPIRYWLGKKRIEMIGKIGKLHPSWKGGRPKCKYCDKQLVNYGAKTCIDCRFKYESTMINNLKPTKIEKTIEEYLGKKFPKEWKYVGNGAVWIARKNPDFININGQKKIIEVFGDYWHKGETGKDRIKHFKEYGFDTLILWEHDIKNGFFINKLNSFIEKGSDKNL